MNLLERATYDIVGLVDEFLNKTDQGYECAVKYSNGIKTIIASYAIIVNKTPSEHDLAYNFVANSLKETEDDELAEVSSS